MSAKKRLLSPLKEKNGVKKKKIFPEMQITPKKKQTDCWDQFFDDDLFACELESQLGAAMLDLSQWQRCVVEQVTPATSQSRDLVLHVRGDGNNSADKVSTAIVHLQGPWSATRIAVGEIVSIQALWDTNLMAYKLDTNQGFCISNSDVLLSGTSVVGSLFCLRKAVLQDRFRGIDANNKVMVVGSLVHELLQTTLYKSLRSDEEIDAEAKNLLGSQDTAYMLYESQLTQNEVTAEVQRFVPNIVDFVEQYVARKSASGSGMQQLQPENFQGTITEIADIEENLWVPQLGLKGKIDVSVRINRKRHLNGESSLGTSRQAIPLELKTGRATFSMEHKGQLILYQLMLKAIGRELSSTSGLLLYLREGIMREINAGHNEQRDLIMLRNELAYYLTHFKKPPSKDEDKPPTNYGGGKLFQPFKLPEPISHHSACGNCAYATICCSFAKTDADLKLPEHHPLLRVMQEVTSHLQLEDYEYFMHWCSLLALEDQVEQKSNFQRALWTETPAARQRQGRAVVGLRLCGNVSYEADSKRFVHTFELKDKEDTERIDLTLSGFATSEYVIVSVTKRLAIASGFIQALSSTTLVVSLERDLRQNYADESFIMDKYESKTLNVFNYTNLSLLLDDTARAAELRKIVIYKQPPSYVKSLPKIIAQKGTEILADLNSMQRAAVLKALTTQSFMLIKGLPGTGKTQTLVALIRLLQLMNKSVIITSHTHSAVDNVLLRLKPHKLPMLRLGNAARVHTALADCSESVLMQHCTTPEQLAAQYAAYNIIGVTCLGASHSIFLHRRFDYCIVDEATQVMQPTVLRPLYFCNKFVLVGDPDQLPPLIRSPEARQSGATESLFQRLDNAETSTAVLSMQYRMNKSITKLANDLTYEGALKCGSKAVEMATLRGVAAIDAVDGATTKCEKWLQRVLHTHIDQAVFLLDTLDCASRSSEYACAKHSTTCNAIERTYVAEEPQALDTSPVSQQKLKKRLSKYTNYCEAALIFSIIKTLLTAGFDPTRIGVIAPYRAQVELLKKLATQHHDYYQGKALKLNFVDVEVNTVDQYQGRDKDIILYSGTKTGPAELHDAERSREAEILADKRRLTVAITRAKHKLILIADTACLEQYLPFQTLFQRIPKLCRLRLEDDKLGFQWQKVFDELTEIIKT